MMKRLHLSLLMLLIGVWAMASDTSVKNSDGVEIWYDFNSNTKTASVTYRGNYSGAYSDEYTGEVVIPSTVTYNGVEYSVTSIGYMAFYNCSGLTSVTIPEGVTSIGAYAFSGCIGLTSVTIPEGVTSIGDDAFSGTAFYNNESNWENNVLYIDNCLIDVKTELSGEYVIKEDTRLIASSAFRNCSGLTSVTIGEGVREIGSSVFSNCSGLTSVTIPEGVTGIGAGAFFGCIGLTSVTIPESVTSIGWCAFEDCSGLTSVTIPESVTSIGDYAFMDCSGLTSVTIPESVTSIGVDAFTGCIGLTSIEVASGKENYIAVDGVLFNKDMTSLIQYPAGKDAVSYNIPEGVTSIGGSAFEDCSGLTSVTIPESVTEIGSSAFYGCSGLTSVTIGEGVTSIGSFAFEDCSGLTSVTIPESVTEIGNYAFSGCSGLTSVTIGEGVTSIGSFAFYNCSGLTSVTIPEGVTSIGDCAFSNCSGLTSIEVASGNENYTAVDGVLFNKDMTSLIQYPAGKDAVLYNIPESVTSIEDYAFEDCSGLTSVTIPESVTSIGDYAFLRCSGLTSIEVASGNENYIAVDGVLFNKDITSLIKYPAGKDAVSYNIPEGVTSIGEGAFSYCSGLTSVTIPEGVTSIGMFAFYNCSDLTSITSKNIMPPPAGGYYVFEDVDKSIPLYVPAESVEAYKSALGWKEFTNILPINESVTSVIDNNADNISVRSIGNTIVVTGTDNYTVYSISGQLLGKVTNVERGIYIVVAEGKSYKVAIR